ncbi:MAG: hypothetical protein AAB620_01160, partial [Patescibacteria group bacterium]
FFLFLGAVFAGLSASPMAQAICPVCTIAVAGGVGLSRWLGIDDSITGLWVGGLIVSMIIWTIAWLSKKNIRFFGRKIIVVLAYYVAVVLPLYLKGIIGDPSNTFCGCGIDKLIVGIASGSIGFAIGAILYHYLKKKNQGKAYFPFQKVVLPIAPLIILTVVFYFLTR